MLIYLVKKNEMGGLIVDVFVDVLMCEYGVEFVLLVGYLRLISFEFCRAYEN